jgi:thiosulfate reductase cytochrome b subunit
MPSRGHSAEPDRARAEMAAQRQLIYRHALPVRLFHWINVICMTILLMSGLQIFNAHPALYWGQASDFNRPIFATGVAQTRDGRMIGVTTIFGHSFDTNGVLGLSRDFDGRVAPRGFPDWATIPGPQWLAMGRRWHFFFAWLFVANGLAYALYALWSRRLTRELVPSGVQLRHIGRSILDHLRLRFPKGEEARHYNVLQKLAYLIVIFVLGPLMVLAGLSMSPDIDALFPWLVAAFGGRQSARTIHFVIAFSFLGFVIIHLLMVLLSGPLNNLRSMITGRYAIETDRNERETKH